MCNFPAQLKHVAYREKLIEIQRDNTFRRETLKSSKKTRYKSEWLTAPSSRILTSTPYPPCGAIPSLPYVLTKMDYMEKRGSGLRKILTLTSKLHTSTPDKQPSFRSNQSTFHTIVPNVNYGIISRLKDYGYLRRKRSDRKGSWECLK